METSTTQTRPDLEKLLELLKEFTATLSQACEMAMRRKREARRLMVTSAALLVGLLTSWLMLQYWTKDVDSIRVFFSNAMAGGIVACLTMFGVSALGWSRLGHSKTGTLEVTQAASSVAGLIRHTSQFLEHRAENLTYSEMIEIRIRLSRAESLLKYCEREVLGEGVDLMRSEAWNSDFRNIPSGQLTEYERDVYEATLARRAAAGQLTEYEKAVYEAILANKAGVYISPWLHGGKIEDNSERDSAKISGFMTWQGDEYQMGMEEGQRAAKAAKKTP